MAILNDTHTSELSIGATFFPDIDGSGLDEASLIVIEPTSDHRQNLQMDSVEDDPRVRRAAEA